MNIGKGEQFKAEFLAISPNNRIPALVDHAPAGGGKPVAVFESGAMLLYLAEKTGKFLPSDPRARIEPSNGCSGRWVTSDRCPARTIISAITPWRKFPMRWIAIAMRSTGSTACSTSGWPTVAYLAGEYSIADMASYPWIVPYERQGQKIEDFPHLERWFETIRARPAVVRAYEKAKEINPNLGGIRTAEERAILFGQTAASVERAAARA